MSGESKSVVVIYTRPFFNYTVLSAMTVYLLALKISTVHNDLFILISVYRPPSALSELTRLTMQCFTWAS